VSLDVVFRDLSVFTRDGMGGNPLAVVDFGLVPSIRWQELAAAIGYSETVILEREEVPVVHIYTPGRRLPFAGHPLVGTASLLGEVDRIRYDAGFALVDHREGETYVTVLSGGPVTPTTPPPFGIGAALVEMPLPYLVVQAPDVETVAGFAPADADGLGELYVWAWEEPGVSVRARFMASDMGVPEDPATGSAAVALARSLPEEEGRLTIHQGEEIGSPSRIRLAWEGRTVRIGGAVEDRGDSSIVLD
jgi:trans-2,3-dihydro-3-hydroxyanthranilate isomerase